MYDIEKYYNASTVGEAVALLKSNPGAKIISGGSDVLIRIREGKLAGASLVCIRDIRELQGVSINGDGDLYIGAGTTFSHIAADPLIRKYVPVLGEAVEQVGGPQVRNVGTIGGNICNGAVSADSAPTVFSLNALLRLEDGEGGRTVPVRDFYLGPGRVDIKPHEVLTHVILPSKEYRGYQGHYIKYSMRGAMDIATISCSVVSKADLEKGILEDVRITFGVAAPVPFRCENAENALKGMEISEALYERAAELVRAEISPRDSWRASKVFRLQIGGEIAGRALRRSIELAGGERR